MRKKFFSLFFATILLTANAQDVANYVNPFIGASTSVDAAGVYHGLGKTFPGATTPFGMVQVSPNTITGGDNAPGYSYEHQTIEGFALTQMSGVGWYGDLGNLLIMPTTGKLYKIAGKENGDLMGYRSKYNKESEYAEAGYYRVFLDRYNIMAETTATSHCGFLRFTFPAHKQARIQMDLARRVGGTSTEQYIHIINENTIEGWMLCTPDGGGWGNGDGHANYTVHFHAELSKPIKKHGIWQAQIDNDVVRKRDEVTSIAYQQQIARANIDYETHEAKGKHLGFFTEFETQKDEVIEMKVALSFVDLEGARRNFANEAQKLTFDQIKRQAYEKWNQALNVIEIEGGTEEERHVFYSALYHTLIDPREYADIDGRYIGGDNKIHTSSIFKKRTIFSGWDVFRSQFPLQTLINPSVVSDMLNSLITLAQESKKKYFERWEFLNAYSGCMLGNPALSVLTDAYIKGIRTYDVEGAYQIAKNTQELFGNEPLGYTEGSISHTLEYAYTDWCLAQLAYALGKEDEAIIFNKRAKYYKNIFNNEAKWFCPRKKTGEWYDWNEHSLTQEGYGCTESNPLQQGWFVPHDIDGLASLLGGKDQAIKMLQAFMEQTPSDFHWNNHYNHANEPVHFVPYMFNQLGAPWLTQYWTRYICANAYHNKVEGLIGNEDVGQMSAWYVLSTTGLHPSCPGNGRLEITSPVFNKVTFHLDSQYYAGQKFTIIAHNNSATNVYIERMLLNGQPYYNNYIDFNDITNGGTLELFMSPCAPIK